MYEKNDYRTKTTIDIECSMYMSWQLYTLASTYMQREREREKERRDQSHFFALSLFFFFFGQCILYIYIQGMCPRDEKARDRGTAVTKERWLQSIDGRRRRETTHRRPVLWCRCRIVTRALAAHRKVPVCLGIAVGQIRTNVTFTFKTGPVQHLPIIA